MKTITMAVTLAALLTGCAQYTYQRVAGAGEGFWDRDSYECERDADQAQANAPGPRSLMGRALISDLTKDRCLQVRGWQKVRVN